MAGNQEKRSGGRVPVVLRIKLRFADVESFIDKFATNISTGGMFIAARKPKPAGTPIKFSILLADDSPVIVGEGLVRWVRELDPEQPRQPPGMGIEFQNLTDDSRELLDRIVEFRQARGLVDSSDVPGSMARPNTPGATVSSVPTTAATSDGAGPPSGGIPEAVVQALSGAGLQDRGEWSERQLAALLDADDDTLARTIRRARELALAGGGHDLDASSLLVAEAVPQAASASEASAKLAAVLGGTPRGPTRRRATLPPPELVQRASSTSIPPPVAPAPPKANGESQRVKVVTVPAGTLSEELADAAGDAEPEPLLDEAGIPEPIAEEVSEVISVPLEPMAAPPAPEPAPAVDLPSESSLEPLFDEPEDVDLEFEASKTLVAAVNASALPHDFGPADPAPLVEIDLDDSGPNNDFDEEPLGDDDIIFDLSGLDLEDAGSAAPNSAGGEPGRGQQSDSSDSSDSDEPRGDTDGLNQGYFNRMFNKKE